jgi:carbamoyltransferase
VSHAGATQVLGLSGGSSPARPLSDALRDTRVPAGYDAFHDAAAVLVRGADIAAAVEEERLNRLKHTNRLPARAIRACVAMTGTTLDAIDRFAWYGTEPAMDRAIAGYMLKHPRIATPRWTARTYLADALSQDLGEEIDPARLTFVEHHRAHAVSAYLLGPFEEALVVTLDGQGDGLSGTVWAGQNGELTRLSSIPERDSLGMLYLRTIAHLGYGLFDEYKVMGLAPYGNPRRFREVFERVCVLQPQGRFEMQWSQLSELKTILPLPRRAGEPFTEIHRDLAASLQEAVERAARHLIEHYQRETGLRALCLAGGVAHNSTMVGRLARSGLFDGVFAQPASHDAGCALGAALAVQRELAPATRFAPISDVYWGTPIPTGAALYADLEAWDALVELQPLADVARDVARLLADGGVIGWVQGRSEFGPRALGNRSILADPRPAENRNRINDLVKQREAYRPFAPAVLEEHAAEVFDMPPGTPGGFMTFTVPVRSQWQAQLGAVTHVDGTARVQTVSRTSNPPFWHLIDAFRDRTGTPVLLNTSFNHSVEPIVDSVEDAVACFLTTGLTHLVIGDCLITRRALTEPRLRELVPIIPDHVRVTHAREVGADGRVHDVYRCEQTVTQSRTRLLTREAHRVLVRADGELPLGSLLALAELDPASAAAALAEIEELWSHRLLRLRPRASSSSHETANSRIKSVPISDIHPHALTAPRTTPPRHGP